MQLPSPLASPRLASPSATDRPVSRLAWRLRTRPSSFQIIPRCTCTCTCTGCTLRRRAAATHGAPPGLVAASLPCQKLQTCLSDSLPLSLSPPPPSHSVGWPFVSLCYRRMATAIYTIGLPSCYTPSLDSCLPDIVTCRPHRDVAPPPSPPQQRRPQHRPSLPPTFPLFAFDCHSAAIEPHLHSAWSLFPTRHPFLPMTLSLSVPTSSVVSPRTL